MGINTEETCLKPFASFCKETNMSTKKRAPTSFSSLDESTLSPKAKTLLEELSKELNLPKEKVAELARMMYRAYKDKA